jgi:hypothetical protein
MRRPRSSPLASTLLALAAASGAALSSGSCARTTVTKVLDTNYDGADITQDVTFWHRLPERSAISNDEGIHGLLSFMLGDDPETSYEGRLKLAKEKGILPPDFKEPHNATMTRGTLAYAIARYVGIKGGVMMRLTGSNARYATRELTYLGILPEGSTDNQSISGLDYVGVISKAQDYAAVNGTGFEPLQKDR